MEGRRLHFIGIGGAGMSGLALVARALGAEVSGSDRADSSYLDRLRAAGIEPVVGHDAANLPDGAEVVVSTAIGDDNPELAKARAGGALVMHRGDLLAEIARLKRSIAVAGTHGKTTTASMAAHVLVELGRDPAYLIGGELRSTGTNAAWGEGEWIVVEADESDRSFLKLRPDFAVITNVELDHHATYRSEGDVEDAFREFAGQSGRASAWVEAPPTGAQETFGIDAGDLSATGLRLEEHGSRFAVDATEVRLTVPGRHNVLNALAALAALRAAGVGVAEAAPALEGFSGARRRFEHRGATPSGAEVYDDYAHHPTEVRATLEAARTLGGRRVVAVFQPHLYSRTGMLARDFGRALALADVVAVLDVYPARERAEDHPGVSGVMVARAAADAGRGRRVYWTPTQDDAARLLESILGPGDVLLTLGAGDVDRLAERLVGPTR
ncbi:MAG: UDP-N-acetylmuramate--alanine ligase [Thermoleophilaceae bacterium]|nr:UDP-N-acetylmuramate--alanine ligase [Thermoleophilaceae bacterium]